MNISLEPNDVITVPRAEMVYVVGAVNRAGAFVLNQRSSISALQALSRAEGLGTYSAASSSKIIRRREGQPVEVQVDLKKILAGQSPDVPLYANDILFIPTSTAKRAGSKTVEAIIQIATGVAIYHRF